MANTERFKNCFKTDICMHVMCPTGLHGHVERGGQYDTMHNMLDTTPHLSHPCTTNDTSFARLYGSC